MGSNIVTSANYIILEPLKPINPNLTVAQLLHFEHCTNISFVFAIFQVMTEWEFHIPTGIPCATAGKGAFFGTLPPRLRGAEPPGGKKVRKNDSTADDVLYIKSRVPK